MSAVKGNPTVVILTFLLLLPLPLLRPPLLRPPLSQLLTLLQSIRQPKRLTASIVIADTKMRIGRDRLGRPLLLRVVVTRGLVIT
jgi:hypothetical protein